MIEQTDYEILTQEYFSSLERLRENEKKAVEKYYTDLIYQIRESMKKDEFLVKQYRKCSYSLPYTISEGVLASYLLNDKKFPKDSFEIRNNILTLTFYKN